MPSCAYAYSGTTEMNCVAKSLVAILFAVSALRSSDEVVPTVVSAVLDVFSRTETVALMRTASGVTDVDPVALTVM